jgi:hypothetical protein
VAKRTLARKDAQPVVELKPVGTSHWLHSMNETVNTALDALADRGHAPWQMKAMDAAFMRDLTPADGGLLDAYDVLWSRWCNKTLTPRIIAKFLAAWRKFYAAEFMRLESAKIIMFRGGTPRPRAPATRSEIEARRRRLEANQFRIKDTRRDTSCAYRWGLRSETPADGPSAA